MTSKTCSKCKEKKSGDEFYKNKSRKDGLNSYCKICFKTYSKENQLKIKHNKKLYYQKNKKLLLESSKRYHHLNKKKISTTNKARRRTHDGIVKELLRGAQRRAKKLDLEFELDYRTISAFVKNYPRCPVRNIKFVVGDGVIHPDSRTIDRIDPRKGYTKDNVFLVSNLANKVKNNGTLNELEQLIKNLTNIQKYKTLPWNEKMKILNIDHQIFDGWYVRNSGKRIKLHSVVLSSLIRDMKQRAQKKEIICTLSRKDIKISALCPLLEIPLLRGKNTTIDHSPTIDRIDNALGYTPTNIAIISHKANVMKNNCSLKQLEQIHNGYVKLLNKRSTVSLI